MFLLSEFKINQLFFCTKFNVCRMFNKDSEDIIYLFFLNFNKAIKCHCQSLLCAIVCVWLPKVYLPAAVYYFRYKIMTEIKNALFNALLRKESMCCLCFNKVDDAAIHTEDEVVLKTNSVTNHLELSEVLSLVLGNEVNGILAFDTVCKECAITALNSYTFIKKCKENAQNLHKAITNLDNSIQHDVEHVYCKSLFISFNEDLTTRDFFDYKRPVNSPSAILKRFQSVSNIGNYKNDVQDVKNDDLDYFELDTEPVIKHKKHKSKPRKNTLPKELILHKDSTHLSYKCSGCLKIFQTLDYLRQHYLRLHAPKTFKCPKCERSYASYKLVEQHLKDCHQTVICVECGKTYKNRFSLKQHELSHRLRFVCQSCGRVYKNKDTFKQHIEYGICGQSARKSATDGLFKCDICNKQYSRKNTLRVHIQFEHTNTGQQHVCSWCNKKFSCQSRLKAHTVKHTQEKNFPCDICGGKFVTKESLLYHTRIHTGEKPYKCSFCDLRFLSSSRRAEHVRRQHMDPTLTCDICKAKFRSHSCLLKHKQRHANPNSRLFAVEGKPQAEENDYCFKN